MTAVTWLCKVQWSATRFHRHAFSELECDDATAERGRSLRHTTATKCAPRGFIKRAMLRMPQALAAAGLRGKMLLQVHDELIFEAPEAEAETLVSVAREVMETACLPLIELEVPLVADAGIADNWMEAH